MGSMNGDGDGLLLNLVEALGASLDVHEVLVNAYGILQKAVSFDHGVLCTTKPGTEADYDWHVLDLPPAWFGGYAEMAPHDFVRSSLVLQPNVVVRDTEMIDRRALERSFLYQRSRELGLDLEQVMAVLVTRNQGWHGGLTLYRDKRVAFTDTDRAKLQRVTPAIGNALRNCAMFRAQSERAEALHALHLKRGVEAIFFRHPAIEHDRTSGVTAMLAKWFAGEPCGANGVPEELLERIRVLSNGPPLGEPPNPWLRGRGAEKLSATLVSLPYAISGPRWAIVLEEGLEWGEIPTWIRQRLTRREAEVATCIVQGWDNKLIADELACSLGTVKKHVQRIFDKVGVESRVQLVHLAAKKRRD